MDVQFISSVSGITLPQVSIELEVDSPDAVPRALSELGGLGYPALHQARTEPWGQTVARIMTSEGAIVGISYAPWMHQNTPSR
jgi:hypothetical protein